MRALVQRVTTASVRVADEVIGRIDEGLVVLVGVGVGDGTDDAHFLATKIAHLRLFGSAEGKFQHSLLEVGGSALVVSQFTLYANTRKGRRPSFVGSAPPDDARRLIAEFELVLRGFGVAGQTGRFGTHMILDLRNDGPVTIWLDSAERGSPGAR